MKQIPLLDLKALHAGIRNEILETITRVVDSGRFVLGEEVEKLEEEIAEIETLHRQSNLPHGKKLSFEKVSINYLKRSFLSR